MMAGHNVIPQGLDGEIYKTVRLSHSTDNNGWKKKKNNKAPKKDSYNTRQVSEVHHNCQI